MVFIFYKKLFPEFTQMCLPISFVPGSLAAGCRALMRSGVRDHLDNVGFQHCWNLAQQLKTILTSLQSTLDQIWTMVGVTISELYDQKAEEVPDQIDAITRSRNSFVNEIQERVLNFRTLIASNMPDEPRPVQPGNPNPQSGAMTHIYKEYTIPE